MQFSTHFISAVNVRNNYVKCPSDGCAFCVDIAELELAVIPQIIMCHLILFPSMQASHKS